MSVRIYKSGEMIVLEHEGPTVPEKNFIQPGNIHFIRRGDLFIVIETFPNRTNKFMHAEIKDEAGSAAGADADAVESYLQALIPDIGGPLSGFEIAMGIVRPDGSGEYTLLNDTDHKTLQLDTPITEGAPNFQIRIPYTLNTTGKKIYYFEASADETFGGVGPGVKATYTPDELVIKPSILENDLLYFRASYSTGTGTWTKNAGWSNGIDIGGTNTGTQLLLTHADVGAVPFMAMIGFASGYIVEFNNIQSTQLQLQFYESTTGVLMAPPDGAVATVIRPSFNGIYRQSQLDPADTSGLLQNVAGNFNMIIIIGPA